MKFEEEFDDIFKRKAEEAKFSFRESDWEKARKMIDQERLAAFNSASRVNYWYISALVLVSSIAVLYFALPETSELARADEVVYTADSKNASEIVSKSRVPESNINAIDNMVKPSGLSVAPDVLGKRAEGEIDMKPWLKSKHQSTNAAIPNETTALSESNTNTGSEFELQEVAELIADSENKEDAGITTQNPQAVALNKKENTLQLFNEEKELQLYPVFLKRYDDEDYVPKQKFNHHAIDVVLGLNYSGGWDNNGNVTAKGLSGFAGLSYNYFLSKKLNLSIGTELYNISNMNQEFYSTTSKNYGFGSTQTQTVLTCQSMIFLSFPLRVFYAADERHRIGLGLHAGTLLLASNTVETSELSDGLKQNVNTVSSKGVYEGMNTNNLLLSASLYKTIGDRIDLQVELYYGLTDLFANTPSNGYQQNSNGIRVGMNYRIFRN